VLRALRPKNIFYISGQFFLGCVCVCVKVSLSTAEPLSKALETNSKEAKILQ